MERHERAHRRSLRWRARVLCPAGLLKVAAASGVALCVAGCTIDDEAVPQPRVTLSGIADGEVLTGQVAVSASVSGIEGLRDVEFKFDDLQVDLVASPPFEVIVDTAAFTDGGVMISAMARGDRASARAEAAVTLDNTAPLISLVEPAGSLLFYHGTSIPLRFEVSDITALSEVTLSANENPLPLSGPPYEVAFELDEVGLTQTDLPADLTLEVQATDAASLQSTRTFDLLLDARLAWSFSTLGEVWAPPVFGTDGSAYFGSRDNKLYALDATGNEQWNYDTGSEIVVSSALDSSSGETLIYVAAGSSLHVLDASGQPTKSAYDAGSTISTKPVVGTSHVYVGTFDGSLAALRLSDNGLDWAYAAGNAVQGAPWVESDNLIVFGSDDRFVHGVDAAGQLVWQMETGDSVWSGVAGTVAGNLLVGSNDGYLYQLDSAGSKLWEFEARGQVWGTATEGPDGTIYVASTFRRLYALDASGEPRWEFETSGFAYATPVVSSSGLVYVGASDGTVYVFDKDGALQWSYAIGAPAIGSVQLSPDESLVLIGSNDRHVYALRTGEGA